MGNVAIVGLVVFLAAFALQPFLAVATAIAYIAAAFTVLAILVER